MRCRLDKPLLMRLRRSLLAVAAVQWSAPTPAGTVPLPVACTPATCPAGVTGFVTSGAAKAPVQSANTLTISQQSADATLNWSSFNIGAGGKVVFQQPSATAIALNRIYDANPSSIFGALTSNGQIYLINANGFLFGPTATVNVGGLLASSLNLSDQTFAAGILAPGSTGAPALQGFVDAGNNVLSRPIIVDAGATLTAADGGRLLLAAPVITNSGTLTAPDGQVVMAAGQSLYLQASQDSDLRGLIVEVDNPGQLLGAPAGTVSGTVTNSASGVVSAPRGNVTLAGLMVNQQGRVSATTSVAANGSIVLQAAQGLDLQFVNEQPVFGATQGGTLVLGPGSVTEVLPETSDTTTTAVASQTQLQSSIALTGQQVFMQDAQVIAPSGHLSVLAAADPSAFQSTGNPNAQIRIDAGTTIDLAGSVAELPMSANLVTVQLRSNEFADDPTQRGGPLQSTPDNTVTVTVDIRADGGKGTPIADLASAIAAVPENVAQRTEAGGTATFQSEGDVVLATGAAINVSGGYTNYLGGTIQTTQLIGANGQLYDIGSANPLLSYVGVINPTFTETYDKWGIKDVVPTPGLSTYEAGYVQGAAAGGVEFAAPTLVLGGSLQGSAVTGPFQRGAPPAGGTLTIGVPSGVSTSSLNVDYLTPAVDIVEAPVSAAPVDGVPLPLQALQLPASYLTGDGFTSAQIYSNAGITLPTGVPLQLPPGASLTFVAPRIDVDSNIVAVDGHLGFESVLTAVTPAANGPRDGVAVGDGVTLDVSGQWTNDATVSGGVGTAAILQNGGSISLQLTAQGSELALGNGVALQANGGAWAQYGGTVTYGQGGQITLDASPAQVAVQFGNATTVEAFGTGTAKGGSFSLLAPRLEISAGSGTDWTTAQRVDDLTTPGETLQIYAPLFSQDGFSTVSLTATGPVGTLNGNDVLTVAAGTTINAQTRTLQLAPGYLDDPTGTPLAEFSQAGLAPLYQRPVTSVTLAAVREPDDLALGNTGYGLIDIQAGASITVDPGAGITLTGEGGVTVDGTLRAPGGKISVAIPSPSDVNSNSADVTDPGFVPTLGIDIAPGAVLDVSGTTILTPNGLGLQTGTILPGGAVTLAANRGTVVVEAGSTIDIAGTSAPLDIANPASVGGYTHETVGSAGGALTLSSGESISLLGVLEGAAGSGTSGAAAAGSLEVDLVRNGASIVQSSAPGLPGNSLEIELVNSTAGAAPSPSDSNIAILGASQIAASGIDSLTLRAGGTGANGNIEIAAAQLDLGRQLVIDSPSLTVATSSTLAAPFVAIGNSVTNGDSATVPVPAAGAGNLSVNAGQIVLYGNSALQGTQSATLNSTGDIQLQGTSVNGVAGPTMGSLATNGGLTLNSLRTYPDTYTDFTLTSLAGNGATITLGTTGASPGAPLSADGSVTVSADNIAVKGSLYAPFGTIGLAANQSLDVGSGALLSVSGVGLDIPFGETQLNQGEWIYVTPSGVVNQITAVPGKQISLQAPNISLQAGATSNVAGGGNLYAYELVPGTGGSYDNLSSVYGGTAASVTESSIPNLFAILPAARNQAGPYDPEESGQAVPGETIYLSGGAGVAAGFYTLLPPRYALAPGAVLIQLQPTYTSATGGTIGTLANGVPVIGGYLSTGTTGLYQGPGLTEYEGVAIYPTGYAAKLAAYTISDASSYFAAQATADGTAQAAAPADAGTFTLTITPATSNSLVLGGTLVSAPGTGGQGAAVNVSAPNLEITAGAAADDGYVQVPAAVLQGWDAGSLTLGGSAAPVPATGGASTPTVTIAVAANSVKVDAGVTLSADQIELVAQQSIDVQGGATLSSTSGASGKALSTLPATTDIRLTDTAGNPLPQAALLAVSDLALPVVQRSGEGGATPGTITVESGASLDSGGALALDAPGSVSIADGVLAGKGASWSLSSGSVAFVGPTSGTPDTLNIDASLLAALQQAGAVRIASQGALDIDTPTTLGVGASGTPTLNSLTLIANDLNNEAMGNSQFGGHEVTLGGNIAPTAGGTVSAATAGSGTLGIVAGSLTLQTGVLTVNGFSQTTAQVAGAIETQGASYLNVGGNLTLNAGELTPAADAVDEPGSTIAAGGLLTIGPPVAVASGPTLPTLIGGSLTLSAGDIEDAGRIVAPSGVIALVAAGNLHLASTASIDAAGTTVQAVDRSAPTPGGSVVLTAGGDVSLDAGSVISVAGSAAGASTAPAGSLTIAGGSGTVTLAGTLDGAGNGGSGASLRVDAGSLTGGLMNLVGNPGLAGFSSGIDVRVHSGDLDLASGATLTSSIIVLTADTGTVDIAGMLDAPSAAQRGLIDLSGGTAVVLEPGAIVQAGAGSGTGRGGEIELNSVSATCGATSCTAGGSITLAAGSVISTGGTGEVVLRAPAVSDPANDLVAINEGAGSIGADISQAGQLIIEPVLVSATTAASVNSDLSNDTASAATYLTATNAQGVTNQAAIAARLGSAAPGTSQTQVQVGVELQDTNSTDTLTLQSFDLSQYSAPQGQGQPAGPVVNLVIQAAGAIKVNGTLSDGFVAGSDGTPTALTDLPSATIDLVAGADLSSANPLAVQTASSAALTLTSQAIVRTGTGDIGLAAAGDVVFQSDAKGGASVYTGGVDGTTPVVFGNGSNQRTGFFATDGGNISISAGANVVGAPFLDKTLDGGNYSVTGWMPRTTTTQTLTGTTVSTPLGQYGVNFDDFDWNVGALAGGDLTVVAAGTIDNLSAATAASSPDGNTTVFGAGGGLRVVAGGDIGSAQIYVGDGIGTLTTGAGLTPIVATTLGTNVGSSFAIGNAQVAVWARQGIQVDAVYNPTFIPDSASSTAKIPQFFTYGADSALSLSSTDGSVTLELVPNKTLMGTLLGPNLVSAAGGTPGFLDLPPNLTMSALQQDIDLSLTGSGAILYPSTTGQLDLFASRDINAAGSSLSMSDSFLNLVPTADSVVQPQSGVLLVGGLAKLEGAIHTDDPTPAEVTAGRDIVDFDLSIPKAADIQAGRDIVNITYQGQNITATDTTLITAGRDLVYPLTGEVGQIAVGGEGALDVFAGRNIDLGTSGGITTIGNLRNANLPSASGADLTLAVGYGSDGADYANFLTSIVKPSPTYTSDLIAYVEAQTGQQVQTFDQAQALFNGLTLAQQTAVIDYAFFNELIRSGRAASLGTSPGVTEGYAAIDALFPGSRQATAASPNPYAGNLSLVSSQIYTLSGGNIQILVPGGSIDVGLASTPVGLIQKPASELGIVAEGTGDVDIYALRDVNVNASRIFTLGGGTILIWSDLGSIDAGNGSKSSLSVPPPVVLINKDGSITLDYGASLAAGSGIRTIQTDPDTPAGDVVLVAPEGSINTGDAGIDAAGHLIAFTPTFTGAANAFGALGSSGVPSDLSGLGASLSGLSGLAAGTTTNDTAKLAESNAAKDASPLAQAALSWLDVFVTGLGEDNCRQDDIECLKRQKTAAP